MSKIKVSQIVEEFGLSEKEIEPFYKLQVSELGLKELSKLSVHPMILVWVILHGFPQICENLGFLIGEGSKDPKKVWDACDMRLHSLGQEEYRDNKWRRVLELITGDH